MSDREIEAIQFREPVSPVEFAEQVRFPAEDNTLSHVVVELTPYIRQPLETLNDYSVENIFIIGPTQSGKTVVAQVAVAWSIDQDPGPMLYVYPDENTAVQALEKKMKKMLSETPVLKSHLLPGKQALSKRELELDSMSINIGWSNSIASLNVLQKKRVIGDEVRLFSLAIKKESNAIKLMQDRLTTYLDAGIGQGLFISSPSTEGDLLHQQLDVPGTLVLRWHVPCPSCGRYQLLDFFTHLKFDKTYGPRCLCQYCGAEFSDKDKKQSWNSRGVYAPLGTKEHPVRIDNDGTVHYEGKDHHFTRVVFWWDSMVSPFRSFARIWKEFIETKDKLHDYKNFIQCWLARFWKETKSKSSVDILTGRKAEYYKNSVPEGVKVLVAGIDTQDDSLYITTWGLGYRLETWLINEERVECDITTTNAEDLFTIVKSHVFRTTYFDADGRAWAVAMTAWDSGGHRTKEIYTAIRRFPNVIAIKGRNDLTRSVKYSVNETHWNVRTVEYLEETESASVREQFHLPTNVSFEFLVQFCNHVKTEHQTPKGVKYVWEAKGPDHFRFSSAYAHVCLDIPIRDVGTLRSRLNEPNFSYNPAEAIRKRIEQEEPKEKPEEFLRGDPFEIHARARRNRARVW